ncbi:signal peptide peptidase SppA [Vreelandella olivaria]|uniref:signal peptide peptidase SppA n=1 Tax=Vreelandella olivaria TaxID=390919 RepID=UPI00201F3054|nr:signal peptide peptidase SppA [Halomonas olivaria]
MSDDQRRNSDSEQVPGKVGESSGEAKSDLWTQGPDVSQRAKQDAGVVGDAGDDAETLRERQRLAQMEMMDRWIGGVLTEQRRTRRWKLFFRLMLLTIVLVSITTTAYRVFWDEPSVSAPTQRHLGLVEVNGVIASDAPANAERIIQGLNRAWSSDSAVAVVLHIDSPGGSPVQSQRIYAEIMRLREQGDKPIFAVIEDVGASGAYYIASAADTIMASPASLVGSIGVIYAGFGFQEAINQLGVERRVMTAGENKAFLDPFQPLDEDVEQFWQTVLTRTHEQFMSDVRAGRGDRLSENPEIFSGLVWSGEQALGLGLIDELASLEQVARAQVGEANWEDYTPRLDPFERLTRRFTQTAAEVLGIQSSSSPLRFRVP